MFNWITGLIESWGYTGILFLMFLENVFPPIPSELIMPLAGFTTVQGDLNIFLVILSGSIGSLAGALLWYYVGRLLGTERLTRIAARFGRILTLSPGEVLEADRWFDRYGGYAVFFGRLVPAVRTLISVPAGISEMPLGRFLLFSGAGTLVWTTLLAMAGVLLGSQYERVSDYVDPVSNLVIVAGLLYYLYRVVTFGRRAREH